MCTSSNTNTTSSSTTALHVFPKRELNIINISTSNSPKNKNKIYTNKKGVCLGYRNDRDKTNESKLNAQVTSPRHFAGPIEFYGTENIPYNRPFYMTVG